MPTELLERDDIAGCREIRFLDRQESNYPTLMRFCMDFDLCVLQIMPNDGQTASLPIFALVNGDYASATIQLHCPAMPSLKSLEQHVQQHQIDILHDYLFDSAEPPMTRQGF
ncbi:hypothetical protein [Cellvibrio polysaccharolyticus]|uniref:Uncharacterized protein n=1 Tax=Cellvibrio polysaccharolyticus TaxID=2082724 RepID=A0A928V463_9GAMM|nr:hypothetical protein [Cellvibrio polysaccharolyticus]MBE8716267.1 hypothetical protein [Cellvibrio polysaccharolyticus]